MAINIIQKDTGTMEFVNDADSKVLLEVKPKGALHSDLSEKVTQFDDFLGSTIASNWVLAKGSDTETVNFAIVADESGKVRGTTGDAVSLFIPTNGVQITGGLNWKASKGNLVFEARVKVSRITSMYLFVGFTDTTSIEGPITISGTTASSDATDAVGLVFDTQATTDQVYAVGVANGVDATNELTAFAPVADTYATYRVEVSPLGVASFYINGNKVAADMTAAVTPSVALCPIVICNGVSSSLTCDIDYIFVQQDR